ncbi:Asp23/Gls24 family envelope stress response protein [Rhodococcus sp. NPDC054953]
MADGRPPATPDRAPTDLELERGVRGRLTVKDRAISKIAAAAALSVPGVVRRSGGLLTLPGRDLPRAEVTAEGGSVAVTLYLAVAWPSPVAMLSREVHYAVTERVETLTGLMLDRLHIVVAEAVPRGADDRDTGVDARQLADDHAGLLAPVPSREPLARPDAAVVAVIAAVLLIGVAVVAGREFLIAKEVIAPAAWLRNSVSWVADLHWQAWMAAAAALGVVLGALLVFVSLTPRTRTHLPLGAGGTVWLRPTDVARMCSARAGTVAGVAAVRTIVDRRRVTVHVAPDGAVPDVELDRCVRESVGPSLDAVASPRELRVRIGRVRS